MIAAADDATRLRFLEFFAVTIRNPHTRRAYARAAGDFLAWCEARGVASLAGVQPLHVAAWVEALGRELAAPSVKQQLAGVRHLFMDNHMALDKDASQKTARWVLVISLALTVLVALKLFGVF